MTIPTRAIEPLRDGPLTVSRYCELTRDVSAGELAAALDARFLEATYRPLGEAVVTLLPAGAALLVEPS